MIDVTRTRVAGQAAARSGHSPQREDRLLPKRGRESESESSVGDGLRIASASISILGSRSGHVDVAHATVLIHAAGTGVTLTLAATPPEERDPRLSETMREAILAAITVAPRGKRPTSGPARPGERVAVHAVALRAVLDEASELL